MKNPYNGWSYHDSIASYNLYNSVGKKYSDADINNIYASIITSGASIVLYDQYGKPITKELSNKIIKTKIIYDLKSIDFTYEKEVVKGSKTIITRYGVSSKLLKRLGALGSIILAYDLGKSYYEEDLHPSTGNISSLITAEDSKKAKALASSESDSVDDYKMILENLKSDNLDSIALKAELDTLFDKLYLELLSFNDSLP